MEKEEKDILEDLKSDYNNNLISALIGAGFSKNISNLFPNWTELLHDMIGELYSLDIRRNYDNYLHLNKDSVGELKTEKDLRDEYISEVGDQNDYLGIVSDYIKRKGIRESIEAYVEERMPYAVLKDDESIALKIGSNVKEDIPEAFFSAHEELLSLQQLQNIYTTNYDNLLEFTMELLQKKNVANLPGVVKNGIELSNNIHNRNIIKIHGDLRRDEVTRFGFDGDNKLCYIIAREDYDTYKEKHEAFTYLMRIAMLQGKFMLIGFSGTDANYKGMVSWMTDVLVNQDGGDTKIYIIDLSGQEIKKELQLYYANHHVEVVNLIDEKRLRLLKFSDEEVYSILSSKGNTKRRDILVHFFQYLKTCDADCQNQFYDAEVEEISQNRDEELPISNSSLLTKLKSNIFAYRKTWQDVSSFIRQRNNIDSIITQLKEYKIWNKFPKVVFYQEHILSNIAGKSEMTADEAYIFALAMDECGLNPHYYFRLIKNYAELDKNYIWQLLKVKEETFNGTEEHIKTTEDCAIYENLQRHLFHLNFEGAKKLIDNWTPQGYYMIAKAMRLAAFRERRDDAYDLLADFIDKEKDPMDKLYAMQIANYISNSFPSPYNIDNYYQYGIDGIGDMLSFMTQQLRKKINKPKVRGWIGSTMNLGIGHHDYERSLRILRYISDSGIYVSMPGIYIFDIASWYIVFSNLYKHFPYPCFFYSIQYNDKDVQRRIGEDFAYSEELQRFNEDIIIKSLDAVGNEETPISFKKGILNVTATMYVAVDESIWFEKFKETVFKQFLQELPNAKDSAELVFNVKFALGSIKNPDNISWAFQQLMSRYAVNESIVSDIIVNNLMINRIQDKQSIDSILLFSNVLSIDSLDLLDTLNSEGFLSKSCLESICDNVCKTNIEDLPHNRVALFQIFNLVRNCKEAVEKVKQCFLSMDIWHCGVLHDSEFGWTEPKYIRLNLLNDKVVWTDDEFEIIKDNLIKNVSMYSRASQTIHKDSFMKNIQVRYLSDMMQFIDGLNDERHQTLLDTRKEIETLLLERTQYADNIDLMMSDQSADVDNALRNIYEGIANNGIEKYQDDVDFLITRAIMKAPVALTRNLRYIRFIVEKHCEEMMALGYTQKLNKLLSVYKDSDSWTLLDLRYAFNYLYFIAKTLKQHGVSNDTIDFWMDNDFVAKFVLE